MARIEFYIGREESHIAAVDDGAVPREGDTINIHKKDYRVTRVAWAVDHADRPLEAKLRAAVELEEKS